VVETILERIFVIGQDDIRGKLVYFVVKPAALIVVLPAEPNYAVDGDILDMLRTL